MGGNHSGGHLEDWALGNSWLHRRESRAKILAALALLIGLSLAPGANSAAVALVLLILVIATGTAALPMLAMPSAFWFGAIICGRLVAYTP